MSSSPFVPLKMAEISWRNGLPFSTSFNDIYFSSEGIEEAHYVFIQGNNLVERWQKIPKHCDSQFIIAETGFGTSLNFLLTWSLWLKHAPSQARLYFFSCEKFPLKLADLKRCHELWPELKLQADELAKVYPILTSGFHRLSFANGRVNLILMLGEALDCFNHLIVCGDAKLEQNLRSYHIDAWFLDGFAPAKNQSIWDEKLFQCISLLSKPGSTAATFSSAAIVKQGLKLAGFDYQKIKGYTNKREMIVAELSQQPPIRLRRCTPWHAANFQKSRHKKAIIVGSGLAGCYTAWALVKRGWQITLVDAASEIGAGASGNKQAILYPQLSAYRSPLNNFMLTAYLYAVSAYQQWLEIAPIGQLSGLLQLAYSEKEKQFQQSLQAWLLAYPQLGQLVNNQQASEIAGLSLDHGGLYIPKAGWLHIQELCRLLVKNAKLNWLANTKIDELTYNNHEWQVAGERAEVLILANGNHANDFRETQDLPLKAMRGQITRIKANSQTRLLKVPLCAEGHILPEYKNMHAIGATYHQHTSELITNPADDNTNRQKAKKITPIFADCSVEEQWAGIRAATPDYLPLVGPVPKLTSFNELFAKLSLDANRWIPNAGSYYPSLFICAGFGSKGLCTIPLCAEWLAASINQEPSFLTRNMEQSLSPARFHIKKIIKTKF